MPLRRRDGSIKGIIEVARDITGHLTLLETLRDKEAKLEHLAQHDSLTGLPNRLLVVDRISQAITTSIGICIFPEDGYDAETMLRNADSAMYKAKEEGRNNLQFYSRDMTALPAVRLNAWILRSRRVF